MDFNNKGSNKDRLNTNELLRESNSPIHSEDSVDLFDTKNDDASGTTNIKKKRKRSAKQKQRERDHTKATMTAKKRKEFNAVKSEVQGAFVAQRKRNSDNYMGEYIDFIPPKYFCINRGLVVVQDRMSKDIVLVARCLPFVEMSMDEFTEYQKVTHTLMTMAKSSREVTSNSAQRSGKMYSVELRGGCDSVKTMGHYMPNKEVQNNEFTLLEWERQQIVLPEIALIYGKKFCALAPLLFEQTKIEVAGTQVSTTTETEFNSLHAKEEAFYSNLTYTVDNFSNCFHHNNDYQTFSFGIWAPICSQTGNLLSKEDGFQSEGGQFLLGSYKTFVDFEACNGIVEILWRGNSDFHSTLPGRTSKHCTRFGSSIQMSNSLVSNVYNSMRGEKEIMKLKLKGLNATQ